MVLVGESLCLLYFPSFDHDQVLKCNPSTKIISLIGKSYGKKNWKWQGAVLASDGYIYCIPCSAYDILQIDSRHVNEQVIEMIEEMIIIM